jgi:hypothetical protein
MQSPQQLGEVAALKTEHLVKILQEIWKKKEDWLTKKVKQQGFKKRMLSN